MARYFVTETMLYLLANWVLCLSLSIEPYYASLALGREIYSVLVTTLFTILV